MTGDYPCNAPPLNKNFQALNGENHVPNRIGTLESHFVLIHTRGVGFAHTHRPSQVPAPPVKGFFFNAVLASPRGNPQFRTRTSCAKGDA